MNFFKDIYKFISYLSLVDIVFFSAIIALLILLVVLIYFIKINKDVIEPKEEDQEQNINKENDHVKKMDNLKAIVDSLEIKPKESVPDSLEEEELLDLKSLTAKLQAKQENNLSNFTEYEKDQEEKAIISYDELLNHQNNYQINYENVRTDDDVTIKKVALNDLINKEEIDQSSLTKEVRVISYEKEEAFLSALKELNRLLN